MSSRPGTEGDREPGALAKALVSLLGLFLGGMAGLVAFQALGLAPVPGLYILLVSGAVSGLLIGNVALGSETARKVFTGVLGAYVGAIAGLFTYVVGYVVSSAGTAPAGIGPISLAAQGVTAFTAWQLLAVALGGLTGILVSQYSWRFEGLLAMVSLGSVVLGYITYSALVTLPQAPPSALPLSLVLFAAETGTLLLVLVYAFYPMDVFQRKRWTRNPKSQPFSRYHAPKVAFQVPTFNEPPELVFDTLDALMEADYPEDRYTIMVLDDSTDPACRRPLERYCREKGLFYNHREDRTGYKAGALNASMPYMDEDVDLIAVIDADYQIKPAYLKETVGYFADEDLGFLQTPQNYRNADQSFLTEQYSYADAYFYQTVLPSRNEGNAIIFCGTMGIVRKDVLEEVGGWSEDHVTEDAELAARIHGAGYNALYINKPYGGGLAPESFEAYKKQLHRWSFGGGQILRTHTWEILSSSRMTTRQKFDHLAGIVHWFDGIFIATIAMVLSLIAAGDLMGFDVVTHHRNEVWLAGLIPLFLLVEGATRLQLSLRHHLDLTFRGTLRVVGMWFSVKFSNTWGALKGLFGVDMPFIRTPKGGEGEMDRPEALKRSVRLTTLESTMGFLLLLLTAGYILRTLWVWQQNATVDLARLLLSGWMILYTMAFLAAPLYAYRSYIEPEQDRVAEPEGKDAPEPFFRLPEGVALVFLGGILMLALILRLMDPLSSPILGAEDPYLHMERAWDVVQGQGFPADYPPGFPALLAPLALLGPDVFYGVARFLPPLFGVVGVLGIYLLARSTIGEAGSLSAAFIVAIMPEHILRTSLLFPTAIDLALLPFFFLFVIRMREGYAGSAFGVLGIGAALFLLHPWVLGLVLPPMALYLIARAEGNRVRYVGLAMISGALLIGLLSLFPGTWNPVPRLMANLWQTLVQVVTDPMSLSNPPVYVDLPWMLTLPALLLGALGTFVALERRGRLSLFAALWTFALLPLILVDWFDTWFLPHRTVVYLSLGVALLAGIFVDAVARRIPNARMVSLPTATAFALAMVVLTMPASASTQPWYRIYDQDDYTVWEEVDALDPSLVVAGSWQARAGYRALTGEPASYNPAFFENETVREQVAAQHPDVVVLIDPHTREAGRPTAFLANWTVVAQDGDTRAYQRR